MVINRNQLVQDFETVFGVGGEIYTFFAPGRVNLIGEHTDYNGGHVFPCAIMNGTYLACRKRTDRSLRMYSGNYDCCGMIEASLDELDQCDKKNWIAYPMGVLWTFEQQGYRISCGLDLYFVGNIPNGAGLSSSASIDIVTGVMLKELFGFDELSMTDLALYGKYAENQYNGVNCGIMDQFVIAKGKQEHAIFLDTATLSYQYVPVHLQDAVIVITCSNKKRELIDSAYNQRRSECERALLDIQKVKQIKTLGELTIDAFQEVQSVIQDPVCRKRARHAVYENQRTIAAVHALACDEVDTFGRLMNRSHISLRDDYEVTGIELDTLVEAAWECEGVIGSRMTGAGFGGCTVSIVKKNTVDTFIHHVGEVYLQRIGYSATFYQTQIGDGARRLE